MRVSTTPHRTPRYCRATLTVCVAIVANLLVATHGGRAESVQPAPFSPPIAPQPSQDVAQAPAPMFDRGLAGLPGPAAIPMHQPGSVCVTSVSWCVMATPGEVRTSCICPGLSGPVRGKVR